MQISRAECAGLIEALPPAVPQEPLPGFPALNARASLKHAGKLKKEADKAGFPALNARASLKHGWPENVEHRHDDFPR